MVVPKQNRDDLKLQILSLKDAPELFALTLKNQKYLSGRLRWADGVKTLSDTKNFIRESLQKRLRNGAFDAGIWYRGQLKGVVGLHDISWEDYQVEIGYWLDHGCEGQGVISRSVRTVMNHAFTVLGVNRMELMCTLCNAKSRAVAERLHFHFEGFQREGQKLGEHFFDLACYSMLASDFKQEHIDEVVPLILTFEEGEVSYAQFARAI